MQRLVETDREQVTSLYDGGPAGVLYEFVVVSIFYIFIGAALAELASAIPSSAAGERSRYYQVFRS